jgi:hypothetical protein
VDGDLPLGLTFFDGLIHGVPFEGGGWDFTVRAEDSWGAVTVQDCSLLIVALPISITSSPSLSEAISGYAYNGALIRCNSLGPCSWSISRPSPIPPFGLFIQSYGGINSARIGGIPAAGTGATPAKLLTFTVIVVDAFGATASQLCSMLVGLQPISLTSNPSPLPDGTTGTPYSGLIVCNTNGTTTFSISAGTLPTGLQLNTTTGAIYGTPTLQGSYTFVVHALDTWGAATGHDFTIQVNLPPPPPPPPPPQPLTVETSTGPADGNHTISIDGTYYSTLQFADATVGQQNYSDGFIVTGGTPPYAFALTSYPPPAENTTGFWAPNLYLNGSTGVFSGSVVDGGVADFYFFINIWDSVGTVINQACYMHVNGTTGGLPGSGTLSLSMQDTGPDPDIHYHYQISASGGTDPYSFTIIAGTLPPGASMDSTGYISGDVPPGTPVAAYNFTVQASDSIGDSGTGNFVLYTVLF